MGALGLLAEELGADERTLRRAARQGTLLASRPSPRRLCLDPGETDYLRTHWPLLAALRRTLRTARNVRLAILYGSVARGDEDEGSDLDVLVSLTDETPTARYRLAALLERIAGQRVDVVLLDRVERDAPLLLARVLAEGRVLIDRDGLWARLRDRQDTVRERGSRAYRRQVRAGARAVKEMTR
jgi:predicted nucleotidyltransferase